MLDCLKQQIAVHYSVIKESLQRLRLCTELITVARLCQFVSNISTDINNSTPPEARPWYDMKYIASANN